MHCDGCSLIVYSLISNGSGDLPTGNIHIVNNLIIVADIELTASCGTALPNFIFKWFGVVQSFKEGLIEKFCLNMCMYVIHYLLLDVIAIPPNIIISIIPNLMLKTWMH